MKLSEIKNKYFRKSAFCLGTSAHLKKLDLSLIKTHVCIGCNQLVYKADEFNIGYICFQQEQKLNSVINVLPTTRKTIFIIPEQFLQSAIYEQKLLSLTDRIIPIHTRFATPGHAEFFSFDLENCVYAGDSIAIEIQLAVWMGCNPIYIIGVDASYQSSDGNYFDDSKADQATIEKSEKYYFPDLKEWLKKVKVLLWSRGIRLLNGAGEVSSLESLPKVRLRAAVGQPKIAVTSKTFCQDDYLVRELSRYFPDVKLNTSTDQLEGEKLVNFLSDADGMILGTEPFTANVIKQLPCLRFVSKYGVGLNNIDFNAAKEAEIVISYKKGVNSDSVAELTLAFALMLIRQIDISIQSYRNKKWNKVKGKELSEITLGIIGYGHVGKVVAQKFAALRTGRILVNDLLDFPQQPPCEFVPLTYLLKESDIVTIHVDAENRNYHFVDEHFISQMKDGAWLINTSRGVVVDENALISFLKSGKLSGAALDVFENEPKINSDLISCPNILTTCHIAGTSNRAVKNMGWAAIEGLLNMFNIKPI